MDMKGIGLWVVGAMCMGMVGCVALPKVTEQASRMIAVPPGPEDMVVDEYNGGVRILISCDDRRQEKKLPDGWIVAYTPLTGKLDTLVRMGEPVKRPFHPHGIDLAMVDGEKRLYVVCHDKVGKKHWIAEYKVGEFALEWLRDYDSPLITSPNAVAAMPGGGCYVSNDRKNHDSMWEAILKQKKATVVRCTEGGDAKVVVPRVMYGNGITVGGDGMVYQASTRGNKIFAYHVTEDSLVEPSVVAKLVGPDNLRWEGNDLLVVCHLRGLAFLRHAKNAEKGSPTVVYQVPIDGEKPKVLYANRGQPISAGSTAVIVDGKLYVCQVFEPGILEVVLESEK